MQTYCPVPHSNVKGQRRTYCLQTRLRFQLY